MTVDPPIRLADPCDARGIALMSRRLIEHGLPWRWRPERVSRAIAAAATNVAVWREHDGLVGFGIMEYLDDDAHLVLIAVREDRQGRGVGTSLLHWLEAAARVAGARRIRLEARRDNVSARGFYNGHGYHELAIRSGLYGGRVDGILLEKHLRETPPCVA